MALTLSEKIKEAIGNGEDPTELVNLAAQSTMLGSLTATAAELNRAADISTNTQVVAAGGAAVTPNADGSTILIPAVTANVTMTLPATPTLGLRYDLFYVGGATDAEDWVITAAAFFAGGVSWNTHGTPDIEPVYSNGSTHNTLTVNNPAAGTTLTFVGNGTNWCVCGAVYAANTPAFSAV